MTEVTDTNFDSEVKASAIPVLVDFYADWCGPCKALHPVLEKLDSEYKDKVKIVKVKIDDAFEQSKAHSVSSIPYMVMYKDGKPGTVLQGFKKEDDIRAVLDDSLF